jgi:hypothetical protein
MQKGVEKSCDWQEIARCNESAGKNALILYEIFPCT